MEEKVELDIELSDNFSNLKNFGLIPPGTLVSVRPCNPIYKDKTYLGLFVGELALSISFEFDENETLILNSSSYNPLILIPSLNTTVLGCESWWKKIKTENDLQEISDLDIKNTWYVKAFLEQLENDATIDQNKSSGEKD